MRYFDSRTSISQIGTKYSLVFEQFRLGLAGIGTSYASYPAKERFHNLRLSIQKPVCVLDIQIPTEEATNPPSLSNMVRPGSLSIILIILKFLCVTSNSSTDEVVLTTKYI